MRGTYKRNQPNRRHRRTLVGLWNCSRNPILFVWIHTGQQPEHIDCNSHDWSIDSILCVQCVWYKKQDVHRRRRLSFLGNNILSVDTEHNRHRQRYQRHYRRVRIHRILPCGDGPSGDGHAARDDNAHMQRKFALQGRQDPPAPRNHQLRTQSLKDYTHDNSPEPCSCGSMVRNIRYGTVGNYTVRNDAVRGCDGDNI